MPELEEIKNRGWEIGKTNLIAIAVLWVTLFISIVVVRPTSRGVGTLLCCVIGATIVLILAEINTIIKASYDGKTIKIKYMFRVKDIPLSEIDSIYFDSRDKHRHKLILRWKNGREMTIKSYDPKLLNGIIKWYKEYSKTKNK